jgi:hypothetical protein
MNPLPRISEEPPYRWLAAVVLLPSDIRQLLNELPGESHLRAQLRDVSHQAATLAMHLNDVDRGVEV